MPILHSSWRQSNEWTEMRMFELKISKNNILLYLLQIYIFAVIAWDYEIFYQIPLLLLFIATMLRYGQVARAIRTSSFFHGYFLMMMYFFLQFLFGFTVSPADSQAYLITGTINVAAILCAAVTLDQIWKIESVLKTIIIASFSVSIYNFAKNLTLLLSGGLASHCYKLFFSRPTYSHSTIPMLCAFSVMALAYFSLKDRWRIKNVVLIAYFTIYVTLSGSRNALIFIIFGVVIYPFLFNGNRDDFGKRFLKVVLVTAAVCGTVVAVIKIPYLYNLIGYRVQDVLEGFSSGNFSESSASSRNTMLVTGMNLIKKNWFWGYGLNTFRSFPGSFGTWSHVQYVESMVSGGIIALICYFFFNIKAIVILRRYFTKLGGFALCLMIYMLICNMFNVCYMDRFMCLIYGVVDAYIQIEVRKEKDACYGIYTNI